MGPFFEIRSLADINSSESGDEIILNLESPYMKKGRHSEIQRRPCEDEGRDWSEASTSQVMPKVAGNHQKLRNGGMGQILPRRLQKEPAS